MMRALPVLEPSTKSLELCVYCPKLCRAACPVSNAEPRESLIPWGKMSTAYFQARGDVPLDHEHAATAWACTGCFGCRERCDHRNDVAGTLGEARAALFEKGVAPAAAVEVSATFSAHQERTTAATDRLTLELGPEASRDRHDRGVVPLLLGCGYAADLPDEARAAARAVHRLSGKRVRPIAACCGLPLLHAGDAAGFERAGRALAAELGDAAEVVAVDPGCALSLRKRFLGQAGAPKVTLLVELAARELPRLARLEAAPKTPVRYHDPCQMGRGLGLFSEPRAVLGRILGRAPDEFDERGPMAACSGAGGLLPRTMPETSAAITRARAEAHEASGGGEVVTACASSLKAFREAGLEASDLATWIARSLGA
jgi:dimethylglycine catabolism B